MATDAKKEAKKVETVEMGLSPELKLKLASLASGETSGLSPMDLVALAEAVEKGKVALRAKEDAARESTTTSVKAAITLAVDEIRKHFAGISDIRMGMNEQGEVFVQARRGKDVVLSIGNKGGTRTGSDGIITKGKYAGMTRKEKREARKAAKEAGSANVQ